ncbi:MAG: diguanylate cyclase [Lysobacteraceae bacterium]|jgi:diguanylate cyclase (GGDEF)-like protein|nr:GGDEF domain-containing protein [Silanimonas sp.]
MRRIALLAALLASPGVPGAPAPPPMASPSPAQVESLSASVATLADRGEFGRAQRALGRLLQESDALGDPEQRAAAGIVAARFLNRVPLSDAALLEANRAMALTRDPVRRCAAQAEALEARHRGGSAALREADFPAADAQCAQGLPLDRARLALTEGRWWLDQDRPAAALAALADADPALGEEAPADLRAAHAASHAEALSRLGRDEQARAKARTALALAPRLTTRWPVLLANKVLYDIARRAGDDATALATLQSVREDERALDEELRARQRAVMASKDDAIAQEGALALLESRNRTLAAQARQAAIASDLLDRAALLLGALLACALLALVHARRIRRRMRRILERDALTGLWTRSHFIARAEAALAKASRTGTPAGFLIFDLDHFKQVNDRHGHASGDRVLQAVAEALRALEARDLRFGRLGGEEFAVLLPGLDLEAALDVAEACRRAIAALEVKVDDEGTLARPSASFGVVDTVVAGYRLRDLLANADFALYRAKGAGRNRIAATPVARRGTGPAAPPGMAIPG